jgi:hypothetical protein
MKRQIEHITSWDELETFKTCKQCKKLKDGTNYHDDYVKLCKACVSENVQANKKKRDNGTRL